MVRLRNEASDDDLTSKKSPETGKLVGPTGSDEYSATVSAPIPWPSAVVPAIVAIAFPEGVNEDALAQLLDPAGGTGAMGPAGAGGRARLEATARLWSAVPEQRARSSYCRPGWRR